jgi:pimeloyl-ACP methyl ester carboxylesterase
LALHHKELEASVLDVQKTKHQTVKLQGVNLFYREAGRRDAPAVLLLHGQPSSSYSFRDVIGPLAQVARVVAPDLPGFGFMEAPDDYEYTFGAMARTIDALTRKIGLERFFLYIHDFGAPVAYYLALAHPDRVLGLIIQNGNAHEKGLGPDWDANKAYWADPTPENRAKLPEWLNFEGVRDTYVLIRALALVLSRVSETSCTISARGSVNSFGYERLWVGS